MARYNEQTMKEREEWVREWLRKDLSASARTIREGMTAQFGSALGSKRIGQLRGEVKVEKTVVAKARRVDSSVKAIPLPVDVDQALRSLEDFMRKEDLSTLSLEMSPSNELLVKATKIERREVFLPFQASKLS
jgi:hypothetical protein